MKLFLDRNRTLLPRIDVMYLLTRVMTLAGIIWVASVGEHPVPDLRLFNLLLGTYVLHLIVFFVAIKGRFDIKLAYLLSILFDIIFVPLLVSYTGFIYSPFFLAFFITVSVGAYVLRFWFAFAAMTILSISYLAFLLPVLSPDVLFGVSIRIGFLWIWFLVVSYASEHMRKSEKRLLKLFDTLNMRTSELEKSQAELELIYENTRTLASILKPDEVVNEMMKIMGTTLQFDHYAVVLRDSERGFFYRARSIAGKTNFNLKAIGEDGNELIRKVCDLDEPIRMNGIRNRDDYSQLSETARSVMAVPMTAHGRRRGLLVAESHLEDRFTDKDVQMLTVVARSAALALENAELHMRTEELSIIDDLTGAYNYRHFVRVLLEERRRAVRYHQPLSIIMTDIDWFKKLNDSYGHEIGNVVLEHLAGVIKQCVRDVDIFARYGGEEFVVILPQTSQAEASVIAERIRQRVADMVVDAGEAGNLSITISIGISSFPENGRSAEDLVSIADQALYRAKDSGKNLVCIA